jgi:hypothetical protein
MKLTTQHLRDWIGSDHLTIDNLLTLLAEALNDEAEARMMRQDAIDYAEQCEEAA